MALLSDAVMTLFYDIAGDPGDHDDWHTYEHMHERLSIPGFLRGTRWVATAGGPRCMAGTDAELPARLGREVLGPLALQRGMASAYLLRPAAPPPMTKEQSIRGADAPMTWLLLATAYEAGALKKAAAGPLDPGILACCGVPPPIESGAYALQYTLTAAEAARSAPHPPRTTFRGAAR